MAMCTACRGIHSSPFAASNILCVRAGPDSPEQRYLERGKSMAIPLNAHHERRKTPRTQLKDILYVNLEPDAGGIVLNLSEGGLLFRSATPLQQEGPICLWFQLRNGQRLKVSAELVWMGQKRKVGGLRFTNLTGETRAQLRNLIAESSAPVGEPPAAVIPSPEPPIAS